MVIDLFNNMLQVVVQDIQCFKFDGTPMLCTFYFVCRRLMGVSAEKTGQLQQDE